MMYNVWTGAKPLLNGKGKAAKFTHDLAKHLTSLHPFSKMRPTTIKGKWGERLASYS